MNVSSESSLYGNQKLLSSVEESPSTKANICGAPSIRRARKKILTSSNLVLNAERDSTFNITVVESANNDTK